MKTPIQDLIEIFNIAKLNVDSEIKKKMIDIFVGTLAEYTQQEKQFAFSCFENGVKAALGFEQKIDLPDGLTKKDFEDFYSKYTEL